MISMVIKMNFPTIKRNQKKVINKANLGMDLEEAINESNTYYLNNNIAVIHKKPTPVQIVKVNYPSRNKAVITEAYYKTPSTTDYNGIYRGKYIDFEAKESHSKTSFPLANIHPHQIEHLKRILRHDAISFLIVSIRDQFFLLKGEDLIDFINSAKRKSIPYSYFLDNCEIIEEKLRPTLDYLKVVDRIYFKGE